MQLLGAVFGRRTRFFQPSLCAGFVIQNCAMWRTYFLLPWISLMWLAVPARAQDPVANSRSITEIRTPSSEDSSDLPPLRKGPVSLIGGAVVKMDPMRDRMVVRPYGGGDVTIEFDVRTVILRGSSPASPRDIRVGTRIYADTILSNGRIFAKTVRLDVTPTPGETKGQVIAYDSSKRVLRINDTISSQPLTVRLDPQTAILFGNRSASPSDLVNGTLVEVAFRSSSEGPSRAEKIDILAQPGGTFTFAGKIAVVDLRDAHLTLTEPERENTFEVGLDSLPAAEKAALRQGMSVVVRARFDGRRYQAQSVEPVGSAQ